MTIEWIQPYEPAEPYPVYSYTVDLGGTEYQYDLTYRERQDGWYLDLYDEDGTAVVTGKRLAVGIPPLYRHRKDGAPSGGQLIVVDTSGANQDPTYEDLGYRVKIAWVPDDDWPDASSTYDVTIEVS